MPLANTNRHSYRIEQTVKHMYQIITHAERNIDVDKLNLHFMRNCACVSKCVYRPNKKWGSH